MKLQHTLRVVVLAAIGAMSMGIAPRAHADVPEALRALEAGDCRRAGDEVNKGIDRDDAQAYFVAGLMLDGSGCTKSDPGKAARYYQRAAELGDRNAPDFLGLLYGTGRGVPQDYDAAYRWFIHPRGGEPVGASLQGEQARVAGYAYTVAHLARPRVKYPRNAERDGIEATMIAVFDPASGRVSFDQVHANTVVGSNIPKPQPFVDAVSAAYAAAIVEAPPFPEARSTRLTCRTTWIFKLQRVTLDEAVPSLGVATIGRTEIASR